MSINGHKQKKREWLRYRDFVLSPYGVIKIKSLGYTVTDAQPAGVGKKEVAQSAVERVEERADSL
ncbi:hypothetical protein [Symbiopectobacterium sp. RP]|uniref:hypothetical protein n=1 Tax=Symbiopectobacterium sp. RP TaxID=3248553 RepID=UPI003D26EC2E